MSTTTGTLIALQEAAAAFLRTGDSAAKTYFTDTTPVIGIFTEQLAALQQKIDEGLRRTGVSVLVRTVTASKANNAIPGKKGFGRVVLAFMVGCTPNVNPSGLHPATVAEKIVWVMGRFKFLGVTPEHESTELLPVQIADQVHYAVLFSLGDLFTNVEPTR